VPACRAHLAPNAEVVPDDYTPRCSNCMNFSRVQETRRILSHNPSFFTRFATRATARRVLP
jgi:hypothetical protein